MISSGSDRRGVDASGVSSFQGQVERSLRCLPFNLAFKTASEVDAGERAPLCYAWRSDRPVGLLEGQIPHGWWQFVRSACSKASPRKGVARKGERRFVPSRKAGVSAPQVR